MDKAIELWGIFLLPPVLKKFFIKMCSYICDYSQHWEKQLEYRLGLSSEISNHFQVFNLSWQNVAHIMLILADLKGY